MPLLLGGEMSMWTDSYCCVHQCGASDGPVPKGAPLFAPSQDEAFGKSISGMIWPHGCVGAAAFYLLELQRHRRPLRRRLRGQHLWATNDALAARGSLVCPTNCSCDQLSAYGTPYALAPKGERR